MARRPDFEELPAHDWPDYLRILHAATRAAWDAWCELDAALHTVYGPGEDANPTKRGEAAALAGQAYALLSTLRAAGLARLAEWEEARQPRPEDYQAYDVDCYVWTWSGEGADEKQKITQRVYTVLGSNDAASLAYDKTDRGYPGHKGVTVGAPRPVPDAEPPATINGVAVEDVDSCAYCGGSLTSTEVPGFARCLSCGEYLDLRRNRAMNREAAERKQQANMNAVADGMQPPYPDEY